MTKNKTRSKYRPISMKISEYIYSSAGRCCINFEENRNSLDIQNGGLKFEKNTIKNKTRRKC